jgi:transcriptional regulator with XRE-family HTH domain
VTASVASLFVKRLRIAAAISQAEPAERMGIDRAYVSELELGQRNRTIVNAMARWPSSWREAGVFLCGDKAARPQSVARQARTKGRLAGARPVPDGLSGRQKHAYAGADGRNLPGPDPRPDHARTAGPIWVRLNRSRLSLVQKYAFDNSK